MSVVYAIASNCTGTVHLRAIGQNSNPFKVVVVNGGEELLVLAYVTYGVAAGTAQR
ncbi:MAG TPA: hypothetical protein VN950_08190 [Terriglobales bacterium]|nr:hypothetical protein [Terriglobales bacterium]